MSTPFNIPQPNTNRTSPPISPSPHSVPSGSGTGTSAALQMTQQQHDFMLTHHERLRAIYQPMQQQRPSVAPRQPSVMQTASAGLSPNPSTQLARPPGQPQEAGRSQSTPTDQRRQFLNSLAAFHKQYNLPLPREIFNGEKDGAVKLGDAWVEMVDLFMMVMRNQGIANIMKLPPENQPWQTFIRAHRIPNPLPVSRTLPRPLNADPENPTSMTTDPNQFLFMAYLTWLQPFEQHMTRHRVAAQRNAAAAGAAGRSPPVTNGNSQQGQAPSPAPTQVASLASNSISAASAIAVPSPRPAMKSQVARTKTPEVKTVQPSGSPPPKKSKSKDVSSKPVPSPIKVDAATATIPWAADTTPETPAVGFGKKRKRDIRGEPTLAKTLVMLNSVEGLESADGESAPDTPASGSTSISTAALPPERPPTPKRARYRVEYRPLHPHLPTLGGWDESYVTSTFSKNDLGQPSRSIHELGVVDMEAVLMGLRSRLSRELGYALTVLSMLSMPHPEEQIGGLPLMHLPDIYLELLSMIEEAALRQEDFDAWVNNAESRKEEGLYASADLNRLSFIELERLGQDLDFRVEEDEDARFQLPRDQTGGQTDVVLAGLNILRNFSMLPENQPMMASRSELFRLLATVSDARLCRLPGEPDSGKPYSILELARVRRDVVIILTNVSNSVNLRAVPFTCTLAVFRLLSTFLTSGWEAILTEDSPYGPPLTIRDSPPPLILSNHRALEAFCKLAASDVNRGVLAHVPSGELVSLFTGLIRLLPTSRRSFDAMHGMEDYLAHCESLALSLYSLAFLSPLSTRAEMRSLPGAVGVLTRVIYDNIGRQYDFKSNPFGILSRRLCETLGVLNGTVSASGDVETMAFSAGSGDGKGWKFASMVVEKGWLASESERLMECLGVRGLDVPAFGELDGMWWAAGE